MHWGYWEEEELGIILYKLPFSVYREFILQTSNDLEKIAYAKKYNLHVEDHMLVVPVTFSIEGAKMLQHTK